MDRDKIIDGLRMTMDLFTFDPTTGEEKDPDDLNDLDRATYDACKGALEILERLDTDSDTISRQVAIDALLGYLVGKRCPDDGTLTCRLIENEVINKLPPANNSEIPNSSDTISRAKAIDALRAMQTYKLFAGDDMLLIDQAGAQTELMMLQPAQPEQLEQCPIYGGMCAYPSDQCYDCPRHAGAKMEVTS